MRSPLKILSLVALFALWGAFEVNCAHASDVDILEKLAANVPHTGGGPLPEIGLDGHCAALECGWPSNPFYCSGVDLDLDPEAGLQFFQVAVRPDSCEVGTVLFLGPDLEPDAANWSLESNTLSDGTYILQGVRSAPLYSSVRHVVMVWGNTGEGWAIRDECIQGLATTHFAGTWSAAGGGGNWSSYCGEHTIDNAGCACPTTKPVGLGTNRALWGDVKQIYR